MCEGVVIGTRRKVHLCTVAIIYYITSEQPDQVFTLAFVKISLVTRRIQFTFYSGQTSLLTSMTSVCERVAMAVVSPWLV